MSANPETIAIAEHRSQRLRAYYQLTKPNLSGLVVLTSVLGFFVAGGQSWVLLLNLVLGTALTAAGACAINMALEADLDARMRRTASRPIPSGRIRREDATAFSLALFAWGFAHLAIYCGWVPALLSLVSALVYAAVYTPLKRVGPVAVWVGAVTGAIPPVMGWAAVTGEVGVGGAVLFCLLFAWQFPHFMSLGFMYREDYARAGFAFVGQDPQRVGSDVFIGTILLGIASVMPVGAGIAGSTYLAVAVVSGVSFAWMARAFAKAPTRDRARAAFFASITYLPVLAAAMVLDRIL